MKITIGTNYTGLGNMTRSWLVPMGLPLAINLWLSCRTSYLFHHHDKNTKGECRLAQIGTINYYNNMIW